MTSKPAIVWFGLQTFETRFAHQQNLGNGGGNPMGAVPLTGTCTCVGRLSILAGQTCQNEPPYIQIEHVFGQVMVKTIAYMCCVKVLWP
jgi:hypothetical protein